MCCPTNTLVVENSNNMDTGSTKNDRKSAAARPPPLAYPPMSPSLRRPYYGTSPEIMMVASPTHEPDPSTNTWTTGLFDCFDDVNNCCLTALCPCVTFGQNAEIIDRGMTPCALAGIIFILLYHGLSCSCWFTCMYRTRLRGLYGLPGNQCNDLCIHVWCSSCAYCQEYRELKNRGYDPFLGWSENQRRRSQLPDNMPPAVPTGMYRHDDKAAS